MVTGKLLNKSGKSVRKKRSGDPPLVTPERIALAREMLADDASEEDILVGLNALPGKTMDHSDLSFLRSMLAREDDRKKELEEQAQADEHPEQTTEDEDDGVSKPISIRHPAINKERWEAAQNLFKERYTGDQVWQVLTGIKGPPLSRRTFLNWEVNYHRWRATPQEQRVEPKFN